MLSLRDRVRDPAEFLAIYGRHRIGKTFLVDQFFKGKGLFFEIMGMKKASRSEQLRLRKSLNLECVRLVAALVDIDLSML